MPKPLTVKMTVPSGSRPSGMLKWLNGLLNPHNMTVTEVTDDSALEQATPSNENDKPAPDYKSAWEEMHRHLSWMQFHPELQGQYLGRNFADIANILIDEAYPGLRDRAAKDVKP